MWIFSSDFFGRNRHPDQYVYGFFAIGRLPAWIAQWIESREDPNWKLCLPRQIYVDPVEKEYIPLKEDKFFDLKLTVKNLIRLSRKNKWY
jgi:hypothetical protein